MCYAVLFSTDFNSEKIIMNNNDILLFFVLREGAGSTRKK